MADNHADDEDQRWAKGKRSIGSEYFRGDSPRAVAGGCGAIRAGLGCGIGPLPIVVVR
jgi:hypothetical protein